MVRGEDIVFSERFCGFDTEDGNHFHATSAARAYEHLWTDINGADSWAAAFACWAMHVSPATMT